MGAVTVRRIRPAEGPLLERVRLAALLDAPTAFASRHEDEVGRPDDEWAQRARGGADGGERATFLAEVDGDVVGLGGGYRTSSAGSARVDVVSMWTSPAARRRGVGRGLVTAVVEWAGATGASEVALWVTQGNRAAEDLYRACGFVPTGAVKPLPSDPTLSEVELVRRLA